MPKKKVFKIENFISGPYSPRVMGDSADVRLEWFAKTSQKSSGKIQDGRTVLDLTLKREDGHWKIVEIKPVE